MIAQWELVVNAFLRCPFSTTGEIYSKLEQDGTRVRNITGRMSDARAHGIIFEEKKEGKLHRYSIKPQLRFTMD